MSMNAITTKNQVVSDIKIKEYKQHNSING